MKPLLCPVCGVANPGRWDGVYACKSCDKLVDWSLTRKEAERAMVEEQELTMSMCASSADYWKDKYIKMEVERDSLKMSVKAYKAASTKHKEMISGLQARVRELQAEQDAKRFQEEMATAIALKYPPKRSLWARLAGRG